jgi:sugar phosphate isomerase/epimerase
VLPLEVDNFVGNVRFLATRVDRVQILCFGKDHVDQLLTPGDVGRLAGIGRETGLGFDIHLPADLELLDPADDAGRLERKLDLLAHVFDLAAPLGPGTGILHLDWPAVRPPADAAQLRELVTRCLAAIRTALPGHRDSLRVENTVWDLGLVSGELAAAGMAVCADFGHLHQAGLSIPAFLERFGPAIRTIHLHGFGPGGDHLPLGAAAPADLAPIIAFLRDFRHTVTIENFRADWLQASLEELDRLLAPPRGGLG